MKKNLFSTMLALLTIVAMLVSVGCKNYDDDISDINKKISDLESSTTTLSGTVSSLQSSVTTLQSSVSKAQSAAEAAQKTADAAASAADVAQDTAEEAQAAADEAQKAADAAQKTANDAVKAAEAAQGTADAAAKAAEAADKAAAAADAKAVAADLAAQAAQAAADKAEADAVAAQAAANAAAAIANAAATKAEFEAFQKLAAEADSTLEASIAANKKLIETNSADIEAAGKLIKENMANIAELQGLVAAAQTSIETIQTNLEALQKIVDGNVAEIESLTKRTSAVEDTLVEIMKTISADTSTVSKLGAAFVELRDQFEKHLTEFENHQKAFEDLQVAITSAHTQFTTDIAELQSSVSEIKTTIDAVKKGLQSQIDDLKADFEKKCGELSAKDEALLADITAQTYRIDTAYFKISSLTEDVENIKNKVENNAVMINDLFNMVNNNSIAISDNAAAIEELRQALKDSTAYWVAYLLAQDAENAKNIEANSYSIALNTLAIGANAEAIEACQTAIANNGDAINALMDALTSAEGRITGLEEAIEATKLYCAVYVEEAKALLFEEIDGVRAEFTQKLEALENKVDANIASLDSKFQGQVDELTEQIKNINETLEGKIQVIEESYAAKLKELDGKVDKNATETAEALAALETAYKEADKGLETAYQAADAALQTQIDALTAQLSDAKTAFEAQIKAANDSIGTVSENVEAVKAALTAHKEAAEAQIAELKKLIGEKGDTTSVSKLTAKVAVLEAQIAEINTITIPELDNHILANESRIAANEAAIATLQGSLTTAQVDIAKIKEQIENHETRVTALETNVKELEEALGTQVQSITFNPKRRDGRNEVDLYTLDKTAAGASGYYALRATSAMYFTVKPVGAVEKLNKESFKVECLNTKAGYEDVELVGDPVVTDFKVWDASKGIIKVIVRYEFTGVDKFESMAYYCRTLATSLVVNNGSSKVQSAFVQNTVADDDDNVDIKGSLPATAELTWALTQDLTKKAAKALPDTIYTKPWNKKATSKQVLLEGYQYGFTFPNIAEYCDNYYMSLDEIVEHSGLDLVAQYKVAVDAQGKDKVSYSPSSRPAVKDSIPVTVNHGEESAEGWMAVGENLPSAEFARELTKLGAEEGWEADVTLWYRLKCGSLVFPINIGYNEVSTSYKVGYAEGYDFTVEDMSKAWTYNFVKNGVTSENTKNPEFPLYRQGIKDGSVVKNLGSYFKKLQGIHVKATNPKGEVVLDSDYDYVDPNVSVALSSPINVIITKEGDQHQIDEFKFTFRSNKWMWDTKYEVTVYGLGDDQLMHNAKATITTGERPGKVMTEDVYKPGSTSEKLVAKGDTVMFYQPEYETLSYASTGIWTSQNAWATLYSEYAKYFSDVDGINQDKFGELIKADLHDPWNDVSEPKASYLYYKDADGKYQLIPAGTTQPLDHESGCYANQTADDKDGHKALRGYVDPKIINAFSTEYAQTVYVATAVGIKVASVRNFKVELESYSLKPNPAYITSVGGVDKAIFPGDKPATPGLWEYKGRDLAGFYSVDGVTTGTGEGEVTINYENSIATFNEFGKTYENKNVMYEYGDNAQTYVTRTYPFVNSNTVKFNQKTSTGAGYNAGTPDVITGVWVKVTGVLHLTGGANINLPSKYFQFDVAQPVTSENFTADVTPEVTFIANTKVTATYPGASADVNGSQHIYNFFTVTDYYGDKVLNTTVTKNNKGVITAFTRDNRLYNYFTYTGTTSNGGLWFDVDNAEYFAGTEKIQGSDFISDNNGKVTLDESTGTISFTCKSGYDIQQDLYIKIPVYFNHDTFDVANPWKPAENLTPFMQKATLTIKVKKN